MVKLPGQSRSMVQLLPPPADATSPLTTVDLARSAEVPTLYAHLTSRLLALRTHTRVCNDIWSRF